jgi:hypothetical protein
VSPTRTVNRAELHAELAASMTENELLALVVRAAHNAGWAIDHVFEQQHYAHRTGKGWPDLILLRDRLLFRELKSETGRISADQQRIIAQLQRAGQDMAVWRPSDWYSGRIEEELR